MAALPERALLFPRPVARTAFLKSGALFPRFNPSGWHRTFNTLLLFVRAVVASVYGGLLFPGSAFLFGRPTFSTGRLGGSRESPVTCLFLNSVLLFQRRYSARRLAVIQRPAFMQNRIIRQRAFQDQPAAVRASHHGAAIRESFPPRLRVGLVMLLRVMAHCSCGHLRVFCQSAQAGSTAKKIAPRGTVRASFDNRSRSRESAL